MDREEFAKQIDALGEEAERNDHDLDVYLRSLAGVFQAMGGGDPITPDQFLALLRSGFDTPPLPAVDERPLEPCPSEGTPAARTWHQLSNLALSQAWDLATMERLGLFKDPQYVWGTDCPGGGGWYNFRVETYLECGFAGWEVRHVEGERVPDEISPAAVEEFLELGEYYE